MSNSKFEQHVLKRIALDAAENKVAAKMHFDELLVDVAEMVDVDVYVRLMENICNDLMTNFIRFFTIAMRKHMPGCETLPFYNDLSFVKDDLLYQVALLVCIQHYFS
jgi:hypothetical protein